MTNDKHEDGVSSSRQVDRRTFIKTTGVAAGVAGGIEGILAARRAPAFAQGTTEPTAMNFDWTATPSSFVSGS